MKLKHLSIFAAIVCTANLNSCQTISLAPPPRVTPELARAAGRQQVDLATLREGRSLFVSRCIECHTLPIASRFTESDWPCIVHEMGGRAKLKPAERDAVLAYILAVHSQSR
jgi:mono/diheme cytochrome c family protein